MTKQASASKSIALIDKVLPSKRISTGIVGLDRVLGADWRTGESGIVVPSLVLLVGPGGIGKTTLMLQMAASIKTKKFLYIATSQAAKEIRDHAERVGMPAKQANCMEIETPYEKQDVIKCIRKHDSQIVVIDAINEMSDPPNGDVQAAMTRIVTALKEEADKNSRTIFLIVRTDGKEYIAGTQRIQNIASTVMQMKMDQNQNRGQLALVIGCPNKNRFGTTREQARFSMTGKGLVPTDDFETPPPEPTAAKDDRKHQVVIRIPSSLHEKLKRETESRQAASPGITITQSDVIRTILFESLR